MTYEISRQVSRAEERAAISQLLREDKAEKRLASKRALIARQSNKPSILSQAFTAVSRISRVL